MNDKRILFINSRHVSFKSKKLTVITWGWITWGWFLRCDVGSKHFIHFLLLDSFQKTSKGWQWVWKIVLWSSTELHNLLEETSGWDLSSSCEMETISVCFHARISIRMIFLFSKCFRASWDWRFLCGTKCDVMWKNGIFGWCNCLGREFLSGEAFTKLRRKLSEEFIQTDRRLLETNENNSFVKFSWQISCRWLWKGKPTYVCRDKEPATSGARRYTLSLRALSNVKSHLLKKRKNS